MLLQLVSIFAPMVGGRGGHARIEAMKAFLWRRDPALLVPIGTYVHFL